MSSHCGLYPSCKCPSDIGRYCGTGHSLDEIIKLNSGEYVIKTDGNAKEFVVENPDRYNLEGRKIRRKHPTNFTPKKKKRKKR